MRFNGFDIKLGDELIRITETPKIEKLTHPKNQKQFDSKRALAQYVAVTPRPYLFSPKKLIAAGNTQSTKAHYKSLKNTITYLKATKGQGLNFTQMDMESAKINLATVASFATALAYAPSLDAL